MSTKGILVITILSLIVLGVGTAVGMYFSYNNEEVALRQQAEAQRVVIESDYDAMWKTIQQQAQVSDEYKEVFKEIFPDLIAGRYSSGNGQMMQWIKEANPSFDASLYKQLMETIDVKRAGFVNDQARMADIIREHTTLCNTYPGKWFITNTEPIEYTVISSTKTKNVIETGIDDDVDLF